MRAAIDHLVYATPDLDATVDDLASRLGVRAAGGGRHDGWGTRNALLDLRDRRYLEILGPDPSQPDPAGPRPMGIDALAEPRLVAWAVRTDDMGATIDLARSAGWDPGEPFPMTRTRTDGAVLAWQLTLPAAETVAALPFLIDWGDSPHPSADAPTGVVLEGLVVEHPDPAGTTAKLRAVGLSPEVSAGCRRFCITRLRTPDGRLVELA